jgi:RNA polymerase sigma-70 factor, ECF subfamily
MTQNVVRFTRNLDLTARSSWRAMQKMHGAEGLADRRAVGGSGRRAAGGLRVVVGSPSDDSLIASVARGDHSALRTLLTRHGVSVFRFAVSLTKDRSLAEEIVNDVFFEVSRRARAFAGRSRVSTWILGIARHKALSALQRRAYERSNEELADDIADGADDPEHAMQKEQANLALAECIRRLPMIHREIIDLVYYHRKSINEIAQMLGIPKSTVKTRMFYARKRIAEMLATNDEVAEARLRSM